jgi:hypothetical protein
MSEKRSTYPFKPLGQKLKAIRQKYNETLTEVSGAVEIDQNMLERIEQGTQRPAEEILLLLISHFSLKDDDAAVLWRLAGYDQPHTQQDHDMRDEVGERNMVLVMAVDPRVIYSDGLQVTANASGVVMNFSQLGEGKRPLVAARIGMSREQAHSVLHALHEALQRSEQRQLPPPSSTDK